MTKKEMIQNIQKLEAAMFLQAKRYELDYGRDDLMYQRAINGWIGVSNAMQSMGIKEDHTLPESREAAELIYQIHSKTA